VLTPSSQTLTIGATATLTATATGTSPYVIPSGTLKFLYGSTVLATLPIASQGGIGSPSTVVFTQSTSGLPPGAYHVTAQYSGDAYDLPATAAAVTVVLTAAPDSVTVSAPPHPVQSGSSLMTPTIH
jgi:hypothetical protein